MDQVRYLKNLLKYSVFHSAGYHCLSLYLLFIYSGAEDDDEIMGDDGLLGGTTTVDDLKISGNISATNTSIIGGKFTQIIWDLLTIIAEIDLQFS